MKIAKGFSLRNIAGDHIVVPVGTKNVSFQGMITLNASGAFLWEALQEERTVQELLQMLLDEYEVETARAQADLANFLSSLQEAGILEG